MKLTKAKVRFILRQKRKGVTTKEISRDMKITQRRVQQVLKEYNETGREPVYGKHLGRPRRAYNEEEAQIVNDAHHFPILHQLAIIIFAHVDFLQKTYLCEEIEISFSLSSSLRFATCTLFIAMISIFWHN